MPNRVTSTLPRAPRPAARPAIGTAHSPLKSKRNADRTRTTSPLAVQIGVDSFLLIAQRSANAQLCPAGRSCKLLHIQPVLVEHRRPIPDRVSPLSTPSRATLHMYSEFQIAAQLRSLCASIHRHLEGHLARRNQVRVERVRQRMLMLPFASRFTAPPLGLGSPNTFAVPPTCRSVSCPVRCRSWSILTTPSHPELARNGSAVFSSTPTSFTSS